MALSAPTLKDLIVSELENRGFDTGGEHSQAAKYAEALAVAIVTHITTDAKVAVTGGSSSGSYQVA